jgi:TolB-like protein/DNA-binding winged helix-turn-helix (wHTH) protein
LHQDGAVDQRVTFGVFEFEPTLGTLSRNGRPVRLQRQPAKMLAALVAQPGEIVERAALQAAIWGSETNVDFERGLNFCAAQIRAALRDSAASPRYIETLPRRGYRFIAPVQSAVATAPRATGSGLRATEPANVAAIDRPRALPRARLLTIAGILVILAVVGWTVLGLRAGQDPPRIVVVPFDNETGSPDFDRVSKNLSDATVARFATPERMPKLRVIGNAADVRFTFVPRDLKAIGESLEARYILLGQVKRDDRQVRVIAHLIRTSDQTHLWANPYDRVVLDLPAQAQLAEAIAAAVMDRIARD